MTAKRRPKGTGTIRARNGRQQAIVRYVDPETSKYRQRAKTFEGQSEAQSWISSEIARIEQEGAAPAATQTVASFLTLWLKSREVTSLAPSTQSWYRSAVERHIVPVLGQHRVDRLTSAHIDAFLASKSASGRLDQSGDGLGIASVRRLYVTLSKAYSYARRMQIVRSNPLDNVDVPAGPQSDPTSKVWTMEQISMFQSKVFDDRLVALWWLAAWTGMRRGELLGLRWPDIDLLKGVISVRRARVQVDGSPIDSTPKTRRGRRLVELDDSTVAVMRRHRTAQAAERLIAGSAWHRTDHVFVWQDGRPLRPDWTSRRFDRLVFESGLPRISLHGLRHSHATALLRAGVHPKIVQERLGHHSAGYTLDVYSAVLPSMQRDAVDRLSSFLGK